MSTAIIDRDINLNSQLVRLPRENLNGLVSWYDMLRFHADDFCLASGQLGQIYMEMNCGIMPRDSTFEVIGASLNNLEKHCIRLGLLATVAQIQRVRQSAETPLGGRNLQSFGRALMEISVRLTDELEARKVFMIEVERAAYWESHLFSSAVSERFPDAAHDIDEAAKCYALERPTACVFHLMRVAEYGLQAIAKAVGVKDDRANWDTIIKKIDAELKKEYKDREFKGMADFLAGVSAHLNAVKLAWRNRAMHVEKKHTMEEAREIYDATRGLMRHLSENLPAPTKLQAIRAKIGL